MEGCGNVSCGLQMQQAYTWPWKGRGRNKKGAVREGERGREIKTEGRGEKERTTKILFV